MARPKQDDPEAKAKILAAATEMFAARGYAGTGVRDIAAAAGVNGAMIHYYFGSKERLYHAILDGAASETRKILEAKGDAASCRERLEHIIGSYAAYVFSHPDVARILHRELLAGGKHLKELPRPFPTTNYKILREVIAEGIRRGEFRNVDVDLAPISLIGSVVLFQLIRPVISFSPRRKKYGDEFVRRLTRHTIDLFFQGIGADTKSAQATARDSKRARRAKAKSGE